MRVVELHHDLDSGGRPLPAQSLTTKTSFCVGCRLQQIHWKILDRSRTTYLDIWRTEALAMLFPQCSGVFFLHSFISYFHYSWSSFISETERRMRRRTCLAAGSRRPTPSSSAAESRDAASLTTWLKWWGS